MTMTLADIASRLEDMALEEDLPELQGLANALANLPDEDRACSACEQTVRLLSGMIEGIDSHPLRKRIMNMAYERREQMMRNASSAYTQYYAASNLVGSITVPADMIKGLSGV